MQAKLILSFIVSVTFSVEAQEQFYRLLATTGEIQIRKANELKWEPAASGRLLQDRETIRSGNASTARNQTHDGKIFVLPPNAQIEIRELRPLTRDGVVMELTALALQRLPSRSDSISVKEPRSAFILHGALPDSTEAKKTGRSQDYLRHEERGALALFEQGYFAGFIIKWNRLLSAFPDFASAMCEAALITAYEKNGNAPSHATSRRTVQAALAEFGTVAMSSFRFTYKTKPWSA